MKEEMKEKKITQLQDGKLVVWLTKEWNGKYRRIVHYIYYIGTLWTVNDVKAKDTLRRPRRVFTASVGLSKGFHQERPLKRSIGVFPRNLSHSHHLVLLE